MLRFWFALAALVTGSLSVSVSVQEGTATGRILTFAAKPDPAEPDGPDPAKPDDKKFEWSKPSGEVSKSSGEVGTGYGVIFDCGSSGTRAHVFNWSLADPIVSISELPNGLKVEPGISQYGIGQGCQAEGDANADGVCDLVEVDDDHPACKDHAHPCPSAPSSCCLTIDEYIAPLLENVTKAVPKTERGKTTLRMHATAGMRLLSAPSQAAIWKQLAEAAESTQFKFDREQDAYTLAGNYEGLFGWLAAQQVNGWKLPQKGWLDLGGASTQIAFAPDDGVITENGIDVPTLEMAPADLEVETIYSISYMMSGQDQGQLRIAQYLYDQAPGANRPIGNPCLNTGYFWNMSICLTEGLYCKKKTKVLFEGLGDHAACEDAVASAIIRKDTQCLQRNCAVAGRYQPDASGTTFFAGSAFFFTADGLGLKTGVGNFTTSAEIAAKGTTWCATKWSDISADDQKYGQNYCFASAYIPQMFDAYGITRNSQAVTYAADVNGEGLEWPLGCQIYHNEIAAASSKQRGQGCMTATESSIMASRPGIVKNSKKK